MHNPVRVILNNKGAVYCIPPEFITGKKNGEDYT